MCDWLLCSGPDRTEDAEREAPCTDVFTACVDTFLLCNNAETLACQGDIWPLSKRSTTCPATSDGSIHLRSLADELGGGVALHSAWPWETSLSGLTQPSAG